MRMSQQRKKIEDLLMDYVNDPMWADHAEVSKKVLRRAALTIRKMRRRSSFDAARLDSMRHNEGE